MAAGAVVGLGFQVLEDMSYSINTAIAFPTDDEVLPVALMLGTRGIVSGIWSHAMYTSIAAFGVGYFLTRRHEPFARRLGVAVAWSLHFFWNSPFFADFGFFPSTVVKAVPVAVIGYLIRRCRRARKELKKAKGRNAAGALRELQREQVRLVMYHGRYGAGDRLTDHEYAAPAPGSTR